MCTYQTKSENIPIHGDHVGSAVERGSASNCCDNVTQAYRLFVAQKISRRRSASPPRPTYFLCFLFTSGGPYIAACMLRGHGRHVESLQVALRLCRLYCRIGYLRSRCMRPAYGTIPPTLTLAHDTTSSLHCDYIRSVQVSL